MRISDWSSDVCSSDLLDAGRQAALQFRQSCFHGGDGGLRVLARAHHDNAADHFTLPVQLGETATKRRATPHRRHVAQQHRHAAGVGRDGYVFEVRAALQVAFARSEEHTSELQSLMRISYAVFCLKQKQYQEMDNLPQRYVKQKSN